ncbi:MAG: SprT family zinc-dependent metalloprotease [Pseudanabaenaceae cyanobacterium bins.39]|nr:SprT family zinc-dependent metalloprotease [Pseudanabaenaceae cyanobacterium bins.39]
MSKSNYEASSHRLAQPLHGDPLPAYTVRISDRAKYVRLSLSMESGLEVVIPPHYDHRKIPELIQQKQNWIARNQNRLNEREAFLQSQSPHLLPHSLNLRAINQTWQIQYIGTSYQGIRLQESQGRETQRILSVTGNIEDINICKFFLKKWLTKTAEHYLKPWLQSVSDRTKLPYGNITIRSQKTLWGSCSNKCNISLNYKLLFLDPPSVEYVLLHELCHTVHMNHSPKFWHLVQHFEPNYKIIDKSLNQAWKIVPAWLDS